MPVLLKQIDFDKFVKEAIENDGMSMEDAVNDVLEMFEGTEYDISRIFVYKNTEDNFIKEKLENNLKVLEKACCNSETYVNASFAMQGIRQVLSDHRLSSNVIQGCWRLCEASHLFLLLTLLLNVEEEEEDDEEDNNAEDKKANMILNLMIVFLNGGPFFQDKANCLTTTEDGANSFVQSLKRSIPEEETLIKYLHCFIILSEQSRNVELFKIAIANVGGVEELFGCASRIHQQNTEIVTRCNILRTTYEQLETGCS